MKKSTDIYHHCLSCSKSEGEKLTRKNIEQLKLAFDFVTYSFTADYHNPSQIKDLVSTVLSVLHPVVNTSLIYGGIRLLREIDNFDTMDPGTRDSISKLLESIKACYEKAKCPDVLCAVSYSKWAKYLYNHGLKGEAKIVASEADKMWKDRGYSFAELLEFVE